MVIDDAVKTLSDNQKKDSLSLTPSERIQFLKLVIDTDQGSTTFCFTDGPTRVWRGLSWAHGTFLLSGVQVSASGEKSRPRLNVPNDDGAFSYFINNGYLENAEVTRYLCHPADVAAEIAIRQVWYVSQVVSANKDVIALQLRCFGDGNRFRLPARRFVQPEFPSVAL